MERSGGRELRFRQNRLQAVVASRAGESAPGRSQLFFASNT
jgi:hypothetical protein